MKIAVFCASLSVGGNVWSVAATAKSGLIVVSPRRNVRGSKNGLDITEGIPDLSEAEKKLPPVPLPADIGPDGFPQLPTVTKLLNSAQSTAQSLTAQAGSLERRVQEVQQEKEARMAKQKEIFEQKLKQQEQANRGMVDQNSKITQEITVLKKQNAAVIKHAHELQDANTLMRSELKALDSRLRAAKSFVASSLETTDDSRARELTILDPKVQERMLRQGPLRTDMAQASNPASVAVTQKVAPEKATADEQEDEADTDEDSDDDSEGASLLAIDSQIIEATVAPVAEETDPKNLLATLEKGVEALAKQERASEDRLKQVFLKDFQVGAQRHAALIAQQQMLNVTRDSLLLLHSHLNVAQSRLQTTKDHLTERLHELGIFIQKLGHFAMAPTAEIPHILEHLPSTLPSDGKETASTATVGGAQQVDPSGAQQVDLHTKTLCFQQIKALE